MPPARALALVAALSTPLATAGTEPAPSGSLQHAAFDANHCLDGIAVSPSRDLVEFLWGCAGAPLLTMECVYDESGYGGFGERSAAAGWHCNRPLPAFAVQGDRRIADVALARAGAAMAWAACFVSDLGNPDRLEKPYHHSECYRLLLAVHETVRRTRRDPRAVLGALGR